MTAAMTLVERAEAIVAANMEAWGWGPLADIEGLAEHDLAVKAATAALASTAAAIETAEKALERHDAKVATCPIQKRSQPVCPKCNATASQSCGLIESAHYAFVEEMRDLLTRDNR